jgi:acetolactate synthase-1/3 small subunit
MTPAHATSDRLMSILVSNEPGIMTKLTGLLQRRGFVIEGISAGKTKENEMLRLTVRVKGSIHSLEQIRKQLFKILETVQVAFIDPIHHVQREMALIKIRCGGDGRAGWVRTATAHDGRIVDVGPRGIIVEMTSDPQKIDHFIELIPPESIGEIARSGIVAMNAASRRRETEKKSGTKFKTLEA